jgi:hypothetical protein
LIWNRPSGEAFRSSWGGDTTVEVGIDNYWIKREKGKENLYQYSEQEPFYAFGTEVPDEIVKLLNINEINLQQQLDAPFLLNESAGSVAEFFNRIANLDKIDRGVSNVSKWIRAIESDIKYKSEDLKAATLKMDDFAHLDTFEIDVEVLEDMDKEKITLANNIRALSNLITSITEVHHGIDEKAQILKAEAVVVRTEALIDERKILREQRGKLDGMIGLIKEHVLETISEKEFIISAEKPVNTLIELSEERRTAVDYRNGLDALIESITENRTIYFDEVKALTYKKNLFDLEMPNVCPLCGTKLK